jgi:hypothetical protein
MNTGFIAMLWMIFALGQMKNGEVGTAYAFAGGAILAYIVQTFIDGAADRRKNER